VFLGGNGDEYGQNVQAGWRDVVIASLMDLPVVFFDPRWSLDDFGYYYEEWDTECTVSQLDSELGNWRTIVIDGADLVVFYIHADSSFTFERLRERETLGEYYGQKRLLICCDSGFPMKDDVVSFCTAYEVPLVASLEELIALLRLRITDKERD